ncbi:hypothetical protein QE152_g31310 [Popillia japonica]|uniref:Uncharacterized protein n=1 Tax=Popillia japonica TaxID=7064 RepID=A0AAW1JBB4_POPJA
MEPYTILKQCDIELSRTYTEEKGEKVTASVSSIYIQLCNRVVYSLNDILNDIVEHFKVPDGEVSPTRYKRNEMMTKIPEDLWEPKRLKEYICKDEYAEVKNVPPPAVHEIFLLPKTEVMVVICKDEYAEVKNVPPPAVHEIFLLPKTEVMVVLELEEIPVIIIKGTSEVTMCDWSTLLNSTCEFTIQANYFNENSQNWEPIIDPTVLEEYEYKAWEQNWEPIIDPTVLEEYEYKAWEVNVKIFQDKSLPMVSNVESRSRKSSSKEKKSTKIFQDKSLPMVSNVESRSRKSSSKEKKSTSATTSEEEEESGDDMVYLQPTNAFHTRSNRNVKTNLSTFLDDSDSENEDVAMEKLAAAISDLFTGDWNESESSESEHSSEGEEESEEEVKSKPSASAQSEISNYKKSTYILIDAKDSLNFTITPTFLKVLNELNVYLIFE